MKNKNIENIIDLLVCPRYGVKLIYDKEKNILINNKNNIAYPIIDYIPDLRSEASFQLKD